RPRSSRIAVAASQAAFPSGGIAWTNRRRLAEHRLAFGSLIQGTSARSLHPDMTAEQQPAAPAPAPADGAPAPQRFKELNGVLIGRIDINPTLAIFRVKPDAGVFEFQPGQCVALGLPSPEGAFIQRAYSIASPPSQGGHLEFYIQLVEGGAFTSLLWE